MEEILQEIGKDVLSFSKIVFSSPKEKSPSLSEKISLTQKQEKSGEKGFLAESFRDKKVFHTHLSPQEVPSFCEKAMAEHAFRQVNLFGEGGEIAFRISKKGKVSRTVNRKGAVSTLKTGHNREKNYRIREGDPIPFMVDLGVFTKEYKIVSQKQDKFRQINRFVEILDHAFGNWEQDEISVLDFGCGKSYLTFFVYYYFAILKQKKVHIIGYDLKTDVVSHCNDLAKRYGYHGLEFVVADVTKDPLTDRKIDFVISLHACDVATDFALHFALERNVPYIFSVPCCQHEVNSQIKKSGGEMDLFLDHGLFKERMCALLTDAFRTRILEKEGYKVDVLEFVDFAHSPKNLMLRARKKKGAEKKGFEDLLNLEEKYGFRQTLLHLREEARK